MKSWSRSGALALVVLVATCVFVGCGRRDPACSEGPGIDDTLGSAERWVRVVSLPSEPTGDGTADVGANVASVGPGLEEEPPVQVMITMHDVLWDDVDDGLRDGDRVYLAMASEGLEREIVAYVVRIRSDGTTVLGGDECLAAGETLLRERLGSAYDGAITSVVGLTQREDILAAIAVPTVASSGR